MRILIFAGSAPFGSAFAEIVKQSTGTEDGIFSADLETGNEEAAEVLDRVFRARLDEIVQATSNDGALQEYVVLCDGISSPAFERISAWAAHTERQILLIAGANIPMALDAVYLKEDVDTLQQLAQSLCAEGRSGIQISISGSDASSPSTDQIQ